jgi:hypothetical protein
MDWEQRFWEKVIIKEADECWLWTGYKNKKGYGKYKYFGSVWSCNRMSLYISTGELGQVACHIQECPNKSCVNPYHLYWGTPSSNTLDSVAVGTYKANTKISKEALENLRQEFATENIKWGETQSWFEKKAKELGVSRRWISKICWDCQESRK